MVGGSGAVGGATTKRLADRGWHCITTSSREQSGDVGLLDLTRPELFATTVGSLPALDGVVVCAGLRPQRALAETDEHHVGRMMAIHVTGPLLLLKELEPKMAEGSGVVLLASVAAGRGSYDPSYATAKAAVTGLGRTLARAWAPRTRVNTLAPGLIEDTPVFHAMTDDFRQRHRASTPLGRLATVDDCAAAIEFLLTHAHLTGVVLHMDGGQSLA